MTPTRGIFLAEHEATGLADLLQLLTEHLESAIESSCVPGTDECSQEDLINHVFQDRYDLHRCRLLIARIAELRSGITGESTPCDERPTVRALIEATRKRVSA